MKAFKEMVSRLKYRKDRTNGNMGPAPLPVLEQMGLTEYQWQVFAGEQWHPVVTFWDVRLRERLKQALDNLVEEDGESAELRFASTVTLCRAEAA